MKNVTDLHRLLRWPVLALLLGLLMVGCNAEDAAPPVAEDSEIGLQVRGLNYSGVTVDPFYVNDRWAGNVRTYAGGGGTATAIGLPKKWTPDLKVEIAWSDDALYAKDPKAVYTRVVNVPEYKPFLGGSFWVAFLPNDEIKVFASPVGPGHPDFPDRELINPRVYCVIRPACHAKYYPNDRVPEMWEVISPVRLSDPPTEQEKQGAMARIAKEELDRKAVETKL